MNGQNPSVDAFNRDIVSNEGYLYTTNARLSSRLANQRLTELALAAADFSGKKVIDIGCGDGTYTRELYDRGKPSRIVGVDPADEAIVLARKKDRGTSVEFEVHSADALPYPDASFDLAHVRGVLHHMDRPFEALGEALRVSRQVIVIEPNGRNPVVKLLERFSPYHRAHHEKSYPPASLEKWVTALGGEVVVRRYAGLVPFFCPDWFARLMKSMEPAVERTAGLRSIACAVFVFVATRVHTRKT
ncbi:MAG: class I SAM-dependent methyltransferase [Bacteroidota bacterium]